MAVNPVVSSAAFTAKVWLSRQFLVDRTVTDLAGAADNSAVASSSGARQRPI